MVLLRVGLPFAAEEAAAEAGAGLVGIVDFDGHEVGRVGVGKRLDQNIFDHAENCSRGTDAQGQSEDCDYGEARAFAQIPRGVTEILPDGEVHQTSLRPAYLGMIYAFLRKIVA